MKKCWTLSILILFAIEVFSQADKKSLFPPPNTSSLGLYGQIPVDHFSGLPQINIPVYEFKSRDISIPLSLSYHVASVKPSTHPGWVGLGWSLISGGVITRMVNDLPDEYVYQDATVPTAKPRGFFYNNKIHDNSSWSSVTNLSQEIDSIHNNYPGRRDKAPDEFQFNFLGFSGSLFMGENGTWKLKSKGNNDFAVKLEIGQYIVQYPGHLWSSTIRACINKITLIDPDGTKYIFGGTPTSLEFNRMGVGNPNTSSRDGGTIPTSWYLTKVLSASGDMVTLDYVRPGYQVVATTTSFASEYFVTQSQTAITPRSSRTIVPISDQVYLVDPVYLQKITGANGSVEFTVSNANILDYKVLGYPVNQPWGILKDAYHYEVFNNSTNFPKSTWVKLEKIEVKDVQTKLVKSFVFNYTESPTNRLFLNSVKEKGLNNELLPGHTFTYNDINGLNNVPYSTIKVDHAGYFNGVDPIDNLFPNLIGPNIYYANAYTSSGDLMTALTPTMSATYFSRREPVEAEMKKGILTTVTYPTGGNTEFVYEPHKYSKNLKEYPLSCEDLNVDKLAGGLRIKELKNQEYPSGPVLTTSFAYVRDYINTNPISSGVLNSATPKYVEEDLYTEATATIPPTITFGLKYRTWSSNSKLPLQYTNGNHVTYTKVTEIDPDGGIQEYTYTNHDNGYLNRTPEQAVLSSISFNELSNLKNNNMELERGLVLNEAIYNQHKVRVFNKVYEYNNVATRFDNGNKRFSYNVRTIYDGSTFAIGNEGVVSKPFQRILYNMIAMRDYIHHPFLKKTTQTTYDLNGLNPRTLVSEWAYDPFRNFKTEAFTDSKAQEVKNEYSYYYDLPQGLDPILKEAKDTMQANHIISAPWEKIVYRNNVLVRKEKNNYAFWGNAGTWQVETTNEETQIGNNAYEVRAEYKNYDEYGNILFSKKSNGVSTSFQYGYNNSKLTALVKGGENTYREVVKRTNSTGGDYAPIMAGALAGNPLTFTVGRLGATFFSVGFSGYPGTNNTAKVTCTITGLNGLSYFNQITICTSVNSGCGVTPSSITLNDLEPGTYQMQTARHPDNSLQGNIHVSVTFPIFVQNLVIGGTKDFIHSSCEENEWDTHLTDYDEGKQFTGKRSGRMENFSPTETISHYKKWLTLNLSAPRKFKYSGWVFSNGPSVQLFLIMKRAGETNYHTYADFAETNTTGKWVYIEKETLIPADVTSMTLRVDNNGGGIVWFDEIRLYPANAFMTTYTHDPLVGLTSTTDPNNITTYYEYDAFGRLAVERDQHQKIIKRLCYNFSGEAENCSYFYNTPKTQSFTRTNCGQGYIGGAYTYSVPANVYGSAISQEDADDKAQKAVNTLGQSFANQYGTCTPFFYSNVINDTYYSQNCNFGETPMPYYIQVPYGEFTSTISQSDADAQAQLYAQDQANTYGGCQNFYISVYYSNNSGTSVMVELTNVNTSLTYYYSMDAYNSGNLGDVPQGTYNVRMYNYNLYYLTYELCYNYVSGYDVTLYSIPIDNRCNSINVN